MAVNRTVLFATLIAAISIFLAIDYYPKSNTTAFSKADGILNRIVRFTSHNSNNNTTRMASTTNQKKMPVYFVSHGGPMTMYHTEHPAYAKMQQLGLEITQKVKPDAIVVFSAHWQADLPNGIQVNVAEGGDLFYDYYGFPPHYYKVKFPHKGSTKVAGRVLDLLRESGIRAQGVTRGLDHGAFVPFKVMFDPEKNPVKVPIVQVSLFDDDKAATAGAVHMRLGEAVQKLRLENILIIVSGMAVHNLRDYMGSGPEGMTMSYTISFDEALRKAVETVPGSERNTAMEELLKRRDARQAHPTFEHLLPIHIGVGAAGGDTGKQIWTMPDGSMSWAQYRFGSL